MKDYESDESKETGKRDSVLAREFAREYVAQKGNSTRAYRKVFECSRQYAHRMLDAWMERPEVRLAIEKYTSADESGAIASPGEVMRTLTVILRVSSDKERLKAAELMLKMRGQLDPKPKAQITNQFALPPGAFEAAKRLPPSALEDEIRRGAEIEVVVSDPKEKE